MNAQRYGVYTARVQEFLDEVARCADPARWRAVLAAKSGSAVMNEARDVVKSAGVSAAVASAIELDTRRVMAKHALTDADLGRPIGARVVTNAVGLAALALAVVERVPADTRQVVLGPFATAGFASVAPFLQTAQR